MIILDENIPEDQCQLLRSWRIRIRQIGQEIGRQGMKDDQQILPLLHELDRPTFFTRDLGFFDKRWCHQKYCVACLAVSASKAAGLIRRFLRHPRFKTKAKRMGAVVRVGAMDIRAWRMHSERQEKTNWADIGP